MDKSERERQEERLLLVDERILRNSNKIAEYERRLAHLREKQFRDRTESDQLRRILRRT